MTRRSYPRTIHAGFRIAPTRLPVSTGGILAPKDVVFVPDQKDHYGAP